ncbi:MAG: hypothetical protein IJB97_08875 [Clostridia bacterium]|nr:hypothetical protein [Clostridia bacterium]
MKKNALKKWLVAGLAIFAVSTVGAVTSVGVSATETDGQTETFVSSDLIMPGASVRIEKDGKNGIRFPVRLTPEKYAAFKSKISESGTLIVPKTLYDENELVLENVGKSGNDTEKVVTTTNWKSVTELENEGTDQEKEVSYMQTMIYAYNIPTDYYNDEFCVKGYVVIDGETVYSQLIERSMTEVAIKALPDFETDADTTALLQSYIKYDVTFDAANGAEKTQQLVGFGEKAAEPEEPTPAQSYAFSHWALNGKKYDFDTVVTEDITLTAVYEQFSRYEVMLGDGSETSGWAFSQEDGKSTGELLYSTFDNNNVMELKLTATGTIGGASLIKIDRAGANAQKVIAASGKKFIGFRIYSPLQNVTMKLLIHTGSAAPSKTYALQQGWNEFSFDLAQFFVDKNVNFTPSEEAPIYRLAIGMADSIFNDKAVGTTYSFYIDEVYATDYDMANVVDFESAGDLNRYSEGTSIYGYARYKTTGGLTVASGVSYDNEYVLQGTTSNYIYGNVVFNAAPNANYSHLWFPADLSAYTGITFRVKTAVAGTRITAYLRSYDTTLGEAGLIAKAAFLTNAANTGDWVEYTLDLTAIEDANLKKLSTFEFEFVGKEKANRSISIISNS